MTRVRIPLAALSLATLLACAASPAGATGSYSVFVGGTLDLGSTAPRSVGPITIPGGAGSAGTGSGRVEMGRLLSYGFASNPISGLTTPQVDVSISEEADAFEVECPNCPEPPTNYDVVFHTRLTGRLRITGAHPYGASLRLAVLDNAQFLEGNLALTGTGTASDGFLAGALTELDTFAVNIPLTFTLSPSSPDILFMILEAHAGGIALGTEVNTAEADFSTRGWEIEPFGPVFTGFPPGVTINVPALNIVDNHWVGPTVDVPVVTRSSALALRPLGNPLRGQARIALSLPESGRTRVEIFDVRGARVATLLDGWQAAGSRVLNWNASATPAGVYFASVISAGRHAGARMVVVR